MVALWNRRELAVFCSREEQRAACRILQDHLIECRLKTDSRLSTVSGSPAWGGGIGKAVYLLYVRRKDYQRAAELLGLAPLR